MRDGAKSSRRGAGYFFLVTGFLACPCHLPLLALLLGGTFLGVFLREHLGLLLLASGLYFVGALFFGLRMIQRKKRGPIAPVNDATLERRSS